MRRPTQLFAFSLIGLVCALASTATSAAAAGRVVIVAGEVNALRGGERRVLANGDSIESGDQLRTGADGRLQVRFTDGSLVSLRPTTEYGIDLYAFTANTAEHQATVKRGALRTISGEIGKRAPERYRLNTSLATIGIRGTCYEVAIDSDGTTYAAVCDGAIFATTTRGETVDLGIKDPFQFARFNRDGSVNLLATRPEIFDRAARIERGRSDNRPQEGERVEDVSPEQLRQMQSSLKAAPSGPSTGPAPGPGSLPPPPPPVNPSERTDGIPLPTRQP